jgi:hypothetical protein
MGLSDRRRYEWLTTRSEVDFSAAVRFRWVTTELATTLPQLLRLGSKSIMNAID